MLRATMCLKEKRFVLLLNFPYNLVWELLVHLVLWRFPSIFALKENRLAQTGGELILPTGGVCVTTRVSASNECLIQCHM